jgi:hypothetical protein
MQAVGTQYEPTRIYGPTGHAIGGTAHLALRIAAIAAGPRHYQTVSVTTTGLPKQQEDKPRRRRRRGPRDSHESAAGLLEQLTDVGRSDPATSGLINHTTFGEWADASV